MTMKPLAVEEWDFRNLPKDTDLQILIEYEYLRSSPLREVIVNWHQQNFHETQFANSLHFSRIQREAGLLKFAAKSPLGRLWKYYDTPNSLSVEAAIELEHEAMDQMEGLPRRPLSIAEAIGKLFKSIRDRRALDSALCQLRGDLPAEITRLHADGIALRFDWFPEPWILIHERNPEYIRARCAPVPPPEGEDSAMWEVVHEIHSTAVLGIEPLCKYHSFVIDWGRAPAEISKAFNLWVNGSHPASRPGKRIEEGWLQKLSAYRLDRIANLTFSEAMKVLKRRRSEMPGAALRALPEQQTKENWSKAVNEVEEYLSGDFIARIRWDFGQFTGVTPSG